MQRDVNQKCLIIYYVSMLFCLYFILSNSIRNELVPVSLACIANICITTPLTFGRFRNEVVQKYVLATMLVICLTVYGHERGSLEYSQGTFLAIVCLCSLHLDKKLNIFIGAYIASIYAFYIIFLPHEMYSDNFQLRDVLLRLATIYIGQVMIIMLISHIELQERQNKAKTLNAERLLKIVEEKRKEALAANDAKSDFLANMSHEIRTPMNAIIGISEIVLRSNIDDVRERLLCIKDSSKTLVSIVNEILDFSKIEAGKFEIAPASYQIKSIISDAATIGEFIHVRCDEDAAVFRPTFMAPGAKVLVVDDNAVNIAVAKGVMAPYGMEVVTASSAQECFELMPRHSFHIIFMDHMMPVMDGLEATKILRSEGVTTPIIALTANAISGARDMYVASGFDAYISKPIEMGTLDRILGEFLPRRFVVGASPVQPPIQPAIQPTIQPPVQPVPAENPPAVQPPVAAVCFPANICRAILAEGRKKFPLMEACWQKGDWRNYAIEVHALKTTAKICHEEELSKLAKEQEAAERAGNYDVLVSGFPRVRALYADLLHRVAAQEEEGTVVIRIPD